MQTLHQVRVVLDGVSVSDVHRFGATFQHACHSQNNSLGMQPPQMFPDAARRRLIGTEQAGKFVAVRALKSAATLAQLTLVD
jgi:hypothetical protein